MVAPVAEGQDLLSLLKSEAERSLELCIIGNQPVEIQYRTAGGQLRWMTGEYRKAMQNFERWQLHENVTLWREEFRSNLVNSLNEAGRRAKDALQVKFGNLGDSKMVLPSYFFYFSDEEWKQLGELFEKPQPKHSRKKG